MKRRALTSFVLWSLSIQIWGTQSVVAAFTPVLIRMGYPQSSGAMLPLIRRVL
jgi:hypothetical protein